jgi:hypothetical protein
MERSRPSHDLPTGSILRMVVGTVACLPAIYVLSQRVGPSHVAADEVRLLFKSDGTDSVASQPVEGYDASTPLDSECLRYGYQYRVHLPALSGPLCAVFYEDGLSESEKLLSSLGIPMAVRFVVTPLSQVSDHPAPESVRGKVHVTPQEFVRRSEEITARIEALAGQPARQVKDASFTRMTL